MFFIRKIKHLLCAAVLFGISLTQQVGAVEYKYSAKEVKCIQNMVYYEARGESDQGVIATIHVVLNRIKDSRFPSKPCSVIQQVNQFSFVGKEYPITEISRYVELRHLVRDVLRGKYPDNTNKSIFFNSTGKAPSNGAKCEEKIGKHYFFSKK